MMSVMPGKVAVSDLIWCPPAAMAIAKHSGRSYGRYQGMISGLIYAACGDLHRSEDLAQETFLSAWKSLCGLREPTKLPAWLCQIARHRTQDLLRKNKPEESRGGSFWNQEAPTPPPDSELLRKEEEAVLWRALAQVPQPYRETLVLYYRQGQSTEQVAAATETSEQAVRQRLTRGREMLRGEVASLMERKLAGSSPTPAFALAVVAAPPALLPQTAKAAGLATAAKGSVAAKTGTVALVLASLGFIGGMTGGIAGSLAALRDDKTPPAQAHRAYSW